MSIYSLADKLKEIDRELAARRKVYPGIVAKNPHEREKLRRQTEILEAIRADYALRIIENPREAGLIL